MVIFQYFQLHHLMTAWLKSPGHHKIWNAWKSNPMGNWIEIIDFLLKPISRVKLNSVWILQVHKGAEFELTSRRLKVVQQMCSFHPTID